REPPQLAETKSPGDAGAFLLSCESISPGLNTYHGKHLKPCLRKIPEDIFSVILLSVPVYPFALL
ncbi:MAG: hypothetical protein JW779_11345, partial [Candidatus Thorarchaeota archaeon]|nr:hypothetical protein [Candidatus Thorarchaeota archaeon]